MRFLILFHFSSSLLNLTLPSLLQTATAAITTIVVPRARHVTFGHCCIGREKVKGDIFLRSLRMINAFRKSKFKQLQNSW
uniref:Secreted protein n=1 Tax=Cucumis sativus TaxID=3659 RepID=A0A0A0LSZ9_CUCSA